MTTLMIVLFLVVGVLVVFLMSALIHIQKIQKELTEIDKEQHKQNKEILELMKYKLLHDEMLLQHIEILKYLVEQDPMIGKNKKWVMPVGEA